MQFPLALREQLKNFIYRNINLSKFKYKILKNDDDLKLLLSTKYFGSFNYFGSNCLLVFAKISDKYVSCIIDRKTLSYDENKVDLESMKIMKINVNIDKSIYDGTILDCIVYGNRNRRQIIITDGYFFKGRNMAGGKYQHKITNIKTFFEANYDESNVENDYDIKIGNFYEIKPFVEILEKNNINIVDGLQTRGLIFYPEISGTKIIYLFNDVTVHQDRKNNTINKPSNNMLQHYQKHENRNDHVNNENNKKMKYRYVAKEVDGDIYATFEMRKTCTADNYKLYSVEKTNIGGRDVYKTVKMDTAYIPTAICSTMCRNFTSKDDNVLVKCKFLEQKGKWIPVELDKERKVPTPKHEIEQKIDIIVEEESDDDSGSQN